MSDLTNPTPSLDDRLDAIETRGCFLAVCINCGNPDIVAPEDATATGPVGDLLPMPFETAGLRDAWAEAHHVGTGHYVAVKDPGDIQATIYETPDALTLGIDFEVPDDAPDVMPWDRAQEIAHVAYEANRALRRLGGLPAGVAGLHWEALPDEQRVGFIEGVLKAVAGATPEQLHGEYLENQSDRGWTYGPDRDPEKLTDPMMVPYGQLPPAELTKDRVFQAVVTAMATGEVDQAVAAANAFADKLFTATVVLYNALDGVVFEDPDAQARLEETMRAARGSLGLDLVQLVEATIAKFTPPAAEADGRGESGDEEE